MSFKYNKGEWAEVYVFLRLLSDGYLAIGDGSLTTVLSRLPIAEVARQNLAGKEFIYRINGTNIDIVSGSTVLFGVSRSQFAAKADELKAAIKGARSGTFGVSPSFDSFLLRIKIDNPKAKNLPTGSSSSTYGGKCDIRLAYIEPTSGIKTNTGFSIKSSFGQPATLMNFSSASKFPVELYGADDGLMATVNSLHNSRGGADTFSRCQAILASGVRPYISTPKRRGGRSVFEDNLRLINADLVKILSECLYYSYFDPTIDSSVESLSNYLATYGSFASSGYGRVFYPKVLKDFLFAVFGGMTPAKPWSGRISANGGFIIAKRNWDIMVALSSNEGDFKDYLFLNTKIEHPATTKKKGDFAYIYKVDSNYFFDLNFSVRFKK